MDFLLHDNTLFITTLYTLLVLLAIILFCLSIYLKEDTKLIKTSRVFLSASLALVLLSVSSLFFDWHGVVRKLYIRSNNYALNTTDDVLTVSGKYNGKIRVVKVLLNNGNIIYKTDVLIFDTPGTILNPERWRWSDNKRSFQNHDSAVVYRDRINARKYQESLSRWGERGKEYEVLKYP